MERLSKVDIVCFDKTGTLTKGRLVVSSYSSLEPSVAADKVLSLSSSLERDSNHPLALAIKDKAKSKGLIDIEVKDYKDISGVGVSGIIEDKKYSLGRGQRSDESCTYLSLKCEGREIGVLSLMDEIRPESKWVISKLQSSGIKTMMLTGDAKGPASSVSKELGLSDYRDSLLPEDKIAIIKDLQKDGKKVVMVGNGVNDAAALSLASGAIAMGGIGSDVAVEASDAVLIEDDLTGVVNTLKVTKRGIFTIRLMLEASIIINAVAVVLASMGYLDSVAGALYHNCGSLLVVLGSITVLFTRKEKPDTKKNLHSLKSKQK